MNINGVFQCDRNPNKGATQHASASTTVNKPAQNLKKKYQKLFYSKEQISIYVLARKFP